MRSGRLRRCCEVRWESTVPMTLTRPQTTSPTALPRQLTPAELRPSRVTARSMTPPSAARLLSRSGLSPQATPSQERASRPRSQPRTDSKQMPRRAGKRRQNCPAGCGASTNADGRPSSARQSTGPATRRAHGAGIASGSCPLRSTLSWNGSVAVLRTGSRRPSRQGCVKWKALIQIDTSSASSTASRVVTASKKKSMMT